MATDTERARLLADYAAAVGEERVLWKRMHEPDLGAVEGVQVYARWKAAAELARRLAAELQTPANSPPAA